MNIKVKRVYEEPDDSDGYRILVDRLWPRGIKKENAKLDEWIKDIAPSNELRKWFAHKPELYPEFREKYLLELEVQQDTISRLKSIAQSKNLTLVYGAKDTEHNQAIVILELLNS